MDPKKSNHLTPVVATLVVSVFIAGSVFFLNQKPQDPPKNSLDNPTELPLTHRVPAPAINHFKSVNLIQLEQDKETRLSLFKNHLLDLNSEGHRAIFENLNRPPHTKAQKDMLALLLNSWGRIDAKSALGAVDSVADANKKAIYTDYILAGWTREDPESAWTWATERIPPPEQGFYSSIRRFDGMLDSLIDLNNYGVAASLVSTISSQNIQGAISARLAKEWAGVAPAEAARWVNGIEDRILKLNAYRGYSESICEIDVSMATRLALSQTEPHLQSYGLVTVVTHFLQEDNPSNATKWIMSQSPAPTMDVAYQAYINGTMHTDPDNAIEAISRVTDADTKEQMAKSAINRFKVDLPDRAINLTLQYVKKNPVGEASKILENWAKYEPEGASQYIASNTSLSETDRRQLQTVLAKVAAKAAAKK